MSLTVVKAGRWKVINRDVIKYIAMFTMLLNHVATIFIKPETMLYRLFINIGYFTAVTMCCFLVEGYQHTHSKKKYGQRLFWFGVISQIPYSFAFAQQQLIEFHGFNMMFTLFLCFIIIETMRGTESRAAKVMVAFFLTCLSVLCDWGLLAPVFTVLFVWAGESVKKRIITFVVAAMLFGSYNFLGGINRFPFADNLRYTAEGMVGIGLAGVVILIFYNGRRMDSGKNFSKWFFYLFYPLHLLILGVIKLVMRG